MDYLYQIVGRRSASRHALRHWCWQVLGVAAFIWLVLASESVAAVVTNQTDLTFYAVEGSIAPPNQSIIVYSGTTKRAIMRVKDNANWLTVSPRRSYITSQGALTVEVNTGGLTAGTYTATVVIRVGYSSSTGVRVTLMVSPPVQPTTPTTSTAGTSTTSTSTGTTSTSTSTTSTGTTTTKRVNLAWDPVTNTTVGGYKIYVGIVPGQYTRTVTAGNIASGSVDGLSVGSTYYFVVTAYNSAGESPPSNEVHTTIY